MDGSANAPVDKEITRLRGAEHRPVELRVRGNILRGNAADYFIDSLRADSGSRSLARQHRFRDRLSGADGLPGTIARKLHLHARRITFPHPRGGTLDVTVVRRDADQLRVLGDGRFDYQEGQIVRRPDDSGWRYMMEVASYYTPPDAPDQDALLAGLSDLRADAVVLTPTYLEWAPRIEFRDGGWQFWTKDRKMMPPEAAMGLCEAMECNPGFLAVGPRLEDLDAERIGAFLEHLEVERHNSIRTRNNRLAAIHSLFVYASFRHPDHAALIQRVLAIPPKRVERRLVSFLHEVEVKALLAAPDRKTWVGRRDHALLAVALQTGLRVSELAALVCADVDLHPGAHLRCHGKGRKERITPLTPLTCGILRPWLAEHRGDPDRPLFPSRRGGPLSRDAVALRVAKHARAAAKQCPSLGAKTVTPHVLRHTCAMQLLTAGVDTSVIALWLGHESVETTTLYLHADLAIKERALARTAPQT